MRAERNSSCCGWAWIALACLVLLAGRGAWAQASGASPDVPVLRVEVNSMLLPVTVRDRSGALVGDLKVSDFQVLDEGKPMTISGMTLVHTAQPGDAQKGMAAGAAGIPAEAGAATNSAAENRFLVFLFDDRHLDPAGLIRVKQAAKKMLEAPLGERDRAVVLSFSGINSGITRDRAVLQAAVDKLSVHLANQKVAHECPDIDFATADQIINRRNETVRQTEVQKARVCMNATLVGGLAMIENLVNSAALHAIAVGEEDTRESLNAVGGVVRTLSKMPGRRMILLVSPGFFSGTSEDLNIKSQVIELAAESNVTISAVDARGLYTGIADASQGASSIADVLTGQALNQLNRSEENEDAMAELADGTGGTFFHNSNDLAGGLSRLAQAPEYLYLLEISLRNVKANGSYHSLRVKVDRDGVKVQARHGYFAPAAASKK
jgi:VWFA-related protein